MREEQQLGESSPQRESGDSPASDAPKRRLRQRVAELPAAEQLQMLRPQRPFLPAHGPETADAVQLAPRSDEKPKTGAITLSARAGGSPFTSDFWENLNVGHAWIDLKRPDGHPDSWGFTVADYQNFPKFTPWKSVEGLVLHPDGSEGATGQLTQPIDEDQLEKGEKWAEAQQGRKYNLFDFNCAAFSIGMFEETTGMKAPTGLFGAMIANPNSLSDAINKHVEKLEKKKKDED